MRDQIDIKRGQLGGRPITYARFESFDDIPMPETQRIQQMFGGIVIRRCRRASRQILRLRIIRIEQSHEIPSARCRCEIDGASSVADRDVARCAHVEQTPHDVLARMRRLARDDERGSPGRIHGIHRRIFGRKYIEHFPCAGARGLHQRGGAMRIREIEMCAGIDQHLSDQLVAVHRRCHQRGAFQGTSRIDTRFALEQQLDALYVVIVDSGSRDDGRLTVLGLRLGAALEQEPDHLPVRGGTRDAERRQAFAIDGVERRTGIAQQRRRDGLLAQGGAMQRRVAVSIRATRIGAVGEERHDGVGTSFETVARRGNQRRQAGVRTVQIGAFGNQSTQQSHVRTDAGQFDDGTLIAIVRLRHAIGIRAASERRQRQLCLSRTNAAQQHCVEFRRSGSGRQFIGRVFVRVWCDRWRHIVLQEYAAFSSPCDQDCGRRAVHDNPTRQRRNANCV